MMWQATATSAAVKPAHMRGSWVMTFSAVAAALPDTFTSLTTCSAPNADVAPSST
jgi:hypothetical protein